jgi:hypothetical protein
MAKMKNEIKILAGLLIATSLLSTAFLILPKSPLPFFISTNSYIIGVSGSDYQVLNGATNQVLYQNPSSSAACNYLLGPSAIAKSGDTIYIKSGAYTVDATWHITVSGVNLTFQPEATLTATANLNTNIVLLTNVNNCVISGVTIDGNKAHQSAINDCIGITENGCSNVVVTNAYIHDCRQFGFSTASSTNCGISNSIVTYCGWNGINLGGCGNPATEQSCYATNNEVYHCSDVGITSYGTNSIITGNYVHDMDQNEGFAGVGAAASHWGIAVEDGGGSGGGNYLFIANNTIDKTSIGIAVSPAIGNAMNYILISGNTLKNIWDNWNPAIYISASSYDILEFNSIINAYSGITIADSSSVGNTVYGNIYSDVTKNFSDSGTDTVTTQPSRIE